MYLYLVSVLIRILHNFNLKEYERNEDDNDHTTNALRLVQKYGTAEEIKEMKSEKISLYKQYRVSFFQK